MGAGEITEGIATHVVLEIDGRTSHRAKDAGLQPGTLRADLLAAGTFKEGGVAVGQLRAADWLGSSKFGSKVEKGDAGIPFFRGVQPC